jgi:hypothetical protein
LLKVLAIMCWSAYVLRLANSAVMHAIRGRAGAGLNNNAAEGNPGAESNPEFPAIL